MVAHRRGGKRNRGIGVNLRKCHIGSFLSAFALSLLHSTPLCLLFSLPHSASPCFHDPHFRTAHFPAPPTLPSPPPMFACPLPPYNRPSCLLDQPIPGLPSSYPYPPHFLEMLYCLSLSCALR